MKLKTLKEMYSGDSMEFENNLKKEAIKWIKEIKEDRCPIESVIQEDGYNGCPAGDCHGCGAYWAIKHFFNINSEEIENDNTKM